MEKIIKIIVADDEIIERKYLAKVFENYSNGELVGSVSNGTDLIIEFEMKKPDVIITDICMPLLSGLDAIKKIRNSDKDVIIIINTAFADFEYARKAIDFGVDGYFLKPSTSEEIIKKIDSLINNRKVNCNSNISTIKLNDLAKFQKMFVDLIMSYHEAYIKPNYKDLQEIFFKIKVVLNSNDISESAISLNILLSIFTHYSAYEGDNHFRTILLFADPLTYCDTSSNKKYLDLLKVFFYEWETLIKKIMENFNSPEAIKNYIENNYVYKITLTDLEKIFFNSGDYLSAKFKKRYNISLFNYIKKVRLLKAREILLNTNLPVAEVALNSGFLSLPQFHKYFLEEYGFTPKKFRELNGEVWKK